MTPGPDHSAEAWVRAVSRGVVRLAIYAFLVWFAVYVLGRLQVVILALLAAGVLAYAMRPPANWLARRCVLIPKRFPCPFGRGDDGRRRMVSLVPVGHHARRAVGTFFVLIGLLGAGWHFTEYMLDPFLHEVSFITSNWGTGSDDDLGKRLAETGHTIVKWYTERVPERWRHWLEEQLGSSFEIAAVQEVVAGWLHTMIAHSGLLVNYTVELVLLPVMAFYLALDSTRIKHEFAAALPRRARRDVLRLVHLFNQIMVSYIVGQAILCIIAGVVVGVGLWALHVKYPLTLGLLAGITRAIPIVGPIIGGVPIVILVLVMKGMPVALAVLAFFSFMHFAESKFLMPLLIGDRMRLHPAVVIIVLLVGQEFGGLMGMFFAPPIAALVRVVVRRYWMRRPGVAGEGAR